MSKSARGSVTLVVTATCAARWRTASASACSATTSRIASASRMSALTKSVDALLAEPGEVGVGAPAAQVVDDDDAVARRVEPGGGVAADEARPSGDDPLPHGEVLSWRRSDSAGAAGDDGRPAAGQADRTPGPLVGEPDAVEPRPPRPPSPARPSRSRSPASSIRRPIAEASAAGSRGGQPRASSPSSNSSAAPPSAIATTARPQAIPSTITRPNGSGRVLAWTTTSSARIAPAGSAWWPAKPTRRARPSRRGPRLQLRRASPASRPIGRSARRRRRTAPAAPAGNRDAASRKTSCPFQVANVATRPTRTVPARRLGQAGRAVERRAVAGAGAEPIDVDGVVDRRGPGPRPEGRPRVVGHRLARRRPPRRPAGPSSRSSRAIAGREPEVVVQVPDDRHAPGRAQAPSRCIFMPLVWTRSGRSSRSRAASRRR